MNMAMFFGALKYIPRTNSTWWLEGVENQPLPPRWWWERLRSLPRKDAQKLYQGLPLKVMEGPRRGQVVEFRSDANRSDVCTFVVSTPNGGGIASVLARDLQPANGGSPRHVRCIYRPEVALPRHPRSPLPQIPRLPQRGLLRRRRLLRLSQRGLLRAPSTRGSDRTEHEQYGRGEEAEGVRRYVKTSSNDRVV